MKTLPTIAAAVMLAASWRGALAQPATAPAPAPLLTLGQAVEEALARNDRVLAARDAVGEAALGLRVAQAAFEPQVVPNVYGWFGQENIANQSFGLSLTQRFSTGTAISGTLSSVGMRNQLGTYFLADTTLKVSQPLLRGFGREVVRQPVTAAAARVADAYRLQELADQAVALDVAAAYYAIVADEAMVEMARDALRRSRELEAAAQAKLKAGLVSQLDVLRARQLVTQAEMGALDAESSREDARDRLRTLLGRGPDYTFSVEAPQAETAGASPADGAIEPAVEQRPELRRAAEMVREAERAVKAASNQLRPQLDVNLALVRQGTSDSLRSSFGVEGFQFATFVAFSMPVIRTSEQAEYRKALLDLQRRQREMEWMRARVVQEVRIALRRRERAVGGAALAAAAEELARKEAEVARLRYQRGLSNNLDLVNAEAGLLAAESRRVAAAAEVALARLGVKAALGTLDPRKDVR